MAIRIQLRRDTAANWTSANPVLRAGEFGVETDTLKVKVGNGTSTWTQISSYLNITPAQLATTVTAVNAYTDAAVASLGNTASTTYVPLSDVGNIDGVASLDATGKIPDSQIPAGITRDTELSSAISTAINNLIDGAPGALDTLNELAAAINDDASYASTITTALGLKAPLASPALTGTPTAPTAAADTSTTQIATTAFAKSEADAAQAAAISEAATDATTKANAAKSGAEATAASALSLHESDTTNIHGIADTAELATKAFAAELLTNATKSNISITGDKNGLTINAENGVADSTTDALAEGGTNKYFTDDRAQDAVATALAAGTHTNISVSYDDVANSISLTGAVTYTDENAQDAIGNAVGTGLSYNDTTGAISVDPSEFALNTVGAPTGNVSLATYKITSLGTPTDSTDAATKAYVDSVTEGLHIHESVIAATTTNVNLANALENGDTLDGVTLATGNRILVKNQTTTSENGIYVVQASGQPVRAADFDTAAEVDSGDFVFVYSGTANASTGWVQTNKPATIGTDPIVFTQFSGAGTYLAGNGLSLNGNTFSINTGTTVDLNTAQTLSNKTLTSPVINGATIGGSLIPSANASYDLGSAANKFKDLYLSGTTLYLDTASMQLDSGNIQFSHSGNTTTIPVANGAHTVTTRAGIETLTNKTLTAPVINNPTGITKSDVGLANVDNTSDANKPVSTATQTALDLKAPLASPALSGVPTAPTAAANTNTTQIATTAYVQTEIADLIAAAPGALDTLDELAAALGDDANYAATITTALGTKAPIASPTFTGTVVLPNNTITNAMLAGSIENNKLVNSSITINGNAVSLGGTVTLATSAATENTLGTVYGKVTTSGVDNTSLGSLTLQNIETGTENTALGNESLRSLTEGSRNAVLGFQAGTLITSGIGNVLLGTSAGSNLVGGSNNIIIGDVVQSTTSNTSNEIIIGNNASNAFKIPGIGLSASVANYIITATDTQNLTNKTITAPTISNPNFTGPISVADPVSASHAVNKAYLEAEIADSVGSDIYPLDSLSQLFDGYTSRFKLKFDGVDFIPSNPYKLFITINGIIQILGNQDQHWLSALPSEGYFLDNDGYIQFGEPIPAGSSFEAKYISGPNTQTVKKSRYPFRATDILLGD
jgi:hypothetical protein